MSADVDDSEDSSLAPEEKETTIRWAKDQDRVHIASEMAGIINRLLHHPHFEEERRRTLEADVVYVAGTIPLGCLSVATDPRASGSNAEVVSGKVLKMEATDA